MSSQNALNLLPSIEHKPSSASNGISSHGSDFSQAVEKYTRKPATTKHGNAMHPLGYVTKQGSAHQLQKIKRDTL